MFVTEILVCVTGAADDEQYRFLGDIDTIHAFQFIQSYPSHYQCSRLVKLIHITSV